MSRSLLLFILIFLSVYNPVLAAGLLPISKQELPSAAAIASWSEIKNYVTSPIDVMQVERVSVACADPRLFPTHPQQATKLYHIFQIARYDHFKVNAASEVCRISSKFKNSRGALTCLRADELEYAVLSDTYRDTCGNFYRGIWEVAFLKQNDSMGMLFAQGRTLYQKPTSDIPNDMYVGPTYFLRESDFLILTSPFAGDLERIRELKESATATHDYDPNTLLFSPKQR